MPMPYSHYVLAQRVADEAALPIKDASHYYVGAFMPDIRYFTKLPREKYHFPVGELEPYRTNPGDVTPDFLLGYKVHLLIDEVWEYSEVKQAYSRAFPAPIRNRMTRRLQALSFELYCLQKPVRVVELEPVENSLTKALRVSMSDIERAVESMQRYLYQHNLAAALEMAKETDLFPEGRLRTMESVVSRMKNPLIRFLVNGVVARASRPIFSRVVTTVIDKLQAEAPSSTMPREAPF